MQQNPVPIESVNLVDLVGAAAQSTLGIIALVVISLAIMALVFFHKENAKVKMSIYGSLLIGAGILLGAVINVSPEPQPMLEERTPVTDSQLPEDVGPEREVPDVVRGEAGLPTADSAYALIEANDLEGAVTAWTARIARYPEAEFNYFHRATALRRMGELERAVADLDRVISLTPGHGAAYNNRGMIRLSQQRIDEGCQDFERAAELGNANGEMNTERHCRL